MVYASSYRQYQRMVTALCQEKKISVPAYTYYRMIAPYKEILNQLGYKIHKSSIYAGRNMCFSDIPLPYKYVENGDGTYTAHLLRVETQLISENIGGRKKRYYNLSVSNLFPSGEIQEFSVTVPDESIPEARQHLLPKVKTKKEKKQQKKLMKSADVVSSRLCPICEKCAVLFELPPLVQPGNESIGWRYINGCYIFLPSNRTEIPLLSGFQTLDMEAIEKLLSLPLTIVDALLFSGTLFSLAKPFFRAALLPTDFFLFLYPRGRRCPNHKVEASILYRVSCFWNNLYCTKVEFDKNRRPHCINAIQINVEAHMQFVKYSAIRDAQPLLYRGCPLVVHDNAGSNFNKRLILPAKLKTLTESNCLPVLIRPGRSEFVPCFEDCITSQYPFTEALEDTNYIASNANGAEKEALMSVYLAFINKLAFKGVSGTAQLLKQLYGKARTALNISSLDNLQSSYYATLLTGFYLFAEYLKDELDVKRQQALQGAIAQATTLFKEHIHEHLPNSFDLLSAFFQFIESAQGDATLCSLDYPSQNCTLGWYDEHSLFLRYNSYYNRFKQFCVAKGISLDMTQSRFQKEVCLPAHILVQQFEAKPGQYARYDYRKVIIPNAPPEKVLKINLTTLRSVLERRANEA